MVEFGEEPKMKTKMQNSPIISIVIPLFNETEIFQKLIGIKLAVLTIHL